MIFKLYHVTFQLLPNFLSFFLGWEWGVVTTWVSLWIFRFFLDYCKNWTFLFGCFACFMSHCLVNNHGCEGSCDSLFCLGWPWASTVAHSAEPALLCFYFLLLNWLACHLFLDIVDHLMESHFWCVLLWWSLCGLEFLTSSGWRQTLGCLSTRTAIFQTFFFFVDLLIFIVMGTTFNSPSWNSKNPKIASALWVLFPLC